MTTHPAVPVSGPDFPMTGEPEHDDEVLRDKIEYTRDDIEATVDELTGRAASAARTVGKPLIAISLIVLAAVGAFVAARRWRS
jgi:hypothetical protein